MYNRPNRDVTALEVQPLPTSLPPLHCHTFADHTSEHSPPRCLLFNCHTFADHASEQGVQASLQSSNPHNATTARKSHCNISSTRHASPATTQAMTTTETTGDGSNTCDDGPTTPRSLADDPKPDDDGSYKCDLCHQKVRVGSGGVKNFMQHRGSSASTRLQPQKKSQAIQMKTLTSFFSKVKVTQNHNTAVASTESYGSPLPDAYALELLARLDRAAQELPIHVPEAKVHDEIVGYE
ncbi:hypothetical protein EDB86DRAFT_2834919 [Lactarius hatsudake]|nr:hypothetical protein EDB86DRAFT_2834919 [Lactarius hatsudake]